MAKETPTTECANAALDELFQLVFICRQLAGDLKFSESQLQARNAKWPDLDPITNLSFNKPTSRFLGVLLLCRSVDIYNWYCREALKLALSSNPALVVDVLRRQTSDIAKTIDKADRQGIDAATEVVRKYLSDRYYGDRLIRDRVHRDLDVMQNPEVELICTCRNILVHKNGYDEFGDIADGIQKLGKDRALIGAAWFPAGHMPIALDANSYLVIDDVVGAWAAELLQQQIFMMDQNFAHVYKLPRKVWKRVSIGRKFLGGAKG